jgi:hypothetical protein
MKKILLSSFFSAAAMAAGAQCTTTNATSCQCLNGNQTNCDLLPDIEVSGYAFQTYMGGPNEYPQQNAGTSVVGQGPDDGRLRLTGSTPNVGRGPMEVRAVDMNGNRWFLCGTDTFSIYDPNATQTYTCPNGEPNPRQLLKQRIYHKNGSTMTYWERFAGSMTYHPAHGHYHVDDWEIMTLRIQDPNEPDPRRWPIVGRGNKVGFCIEDYQDCSTANGHCRDSLNNILTNGNIINFGLGGGNYGCSLVFQGITTGYTDIYWETLDGQWINIDPNICNGQYYVVIEVDPHNYFLESEENANNYFAVPITLTMQNNPGNPVISITPLDNQFTTLCQNDSVTLRASAGTSISWSTGATTQDIRVPSTPGTYTVTVTDYCGTGTATYTINQAAPVSTPTATGDTTCTNNTATLTASGTGTIRWYDNNGNIVATGGTFITPALTSSTTYYAVNTAVHNDTAFATPYNNNNGSGDWKQSAQYEIFKALANCTILSVRVYAQNAGNRTFQLTDSVGNVLQTVTANVPSGSSRVTLNFNCNANTSYRLSVLATTGNLYLYRNSSANINYPYGVPGVLNITGSSGGASYYYYCYDWDVASANVVCESAMVPVLAYVNNCATVGENMAFRNSIAVYPNPNSGTFTLSFTAQTQGNIGLTMKDLMGKTVYEENVGSFNGKYNKEMSVQGVSKGIYFLTIQYEGKPYYTKVVIQ